MAQNNITTCQRKALSPVHSHYVSVAGGEARDKPLLNSLLFMPSQLRCTICCDFSIFLPTPCSAHTEYAMMLGSHTPMHVYQYTLCKWTFTILERYTCIHTHIHTYTHIHTQIHTYTHIHTQQVHMHCYTTHHNMCEAHVVRIGALKVHIQSTLAQHTVYTWQRIEL